MWAIMKHESRPKRVPNKGYRYRYRYRIYFGLEISISYRRYRPTSNLHYLLGHGSGMVVKKTARKYSQPFSQGGCYRQHIQLDLKSIGMTWEVAQQLAVNREGWRRRVAQ